MKFKALLDMWKKAAAPAVTRNGTRYVCRWTTLRACSRSPICFRTVGRGHHHRFAAPSSLDEIAAAMPYQRGAKVISHDDHGDPLYEDVGLTPRFVELTRSFKKSLTEASEKPT